MYGDQFGEFVCGHWDLEGLTALAVRCYHLSQNFFFRI